jgi:cellobiose phosphorylase
LGVKPEINGLKLEPCLPTSWKGAKISRVFRGVKYNIEYIPANEYAILVDGKKIEGNLLPISKQGSEYNVICCYVK